ncbi:MAG TPA: hypothetical protein VGF23_04725 [Gaiellaceae bacterium]
MRTTRILTLVLVATAVAATAAASRAAPARTSWARISGPTQPGVQLGLARTPDGVLHVIWNRGATPTSIFETRLSPSGKTTGTSTVATGFDGNGGLALVAAPDQSLRLFAAGATQPGSTAYGINTFTAPASGGTWTLQSAYWGGATANSAGAIGATLTKDGQPVTAWRGFAAMGVPPGSIPQSGYYGGMTESQLATDAATGAVVLSGVTNSGQGGVYVQQVLPSAGTRAVLPLPFGFNDWNSSLSGRIGAAGVYVAYADTKAVHLVRYGGGTQTLAHGAFTSAATCAGPDGRLWVAWGGATSGLFVTRSNKAASAFEPVQKLAVPQGGSGGLSFVQCEGSAGPADLFADVPGGSAQGFSQTHVLPQLSLRAQASKTKVTIAVRDAGDPLAGVSVRVGGKSVTTNALGQAALTLRAGSYSANATMANYAPASIRFSVR